MARAEQPFVRSVPALIGDVGELVNPDAMRRTQTHCQRLDRTASVSEPAALSMAAGPPDHAGPGRNEEPGRKAVADRRDGECAVGISIIGEPHPFRDVPPSDRGEDQHSAPTNSCSQFGLPPPSLNCT